MIVDGQMEGQAEGEQGHDQGEPLDDAALPRKQCHDHGSGSGHKGRIASISNRSAQIRCLALLEVHGKAEIGNQEQGALRQLPATLHRNECFRTARAGPKRRGRVRCPLPGCRRR